MSGLSDADLQAALHDLTGQKFVVSASTRGVLEKKLAKLQAAEGSNGVATKKGSEAAVSVESPAQTTKTKSSRRSTKVTSTTSSTVSTDAPFSKPSTPAASLMRDMDTQVSFNSTAAMDDSALSDVDLQDKLYELTGTKYPVTDSTRRSLTQKLTKLESTNSGQKTPERQPASPGRKSLPAAATTTRSPTKQVKPVTPAAVPTYTVQDSEEEDDGLEVLPPRAGRVTPPRRSMPVLSGGRSGNNARLSMPAGGISSTTPSGYSSTTRMSLDRPGGYQPNADEADTSSAPRSSLFSRFTTTSSESTRRTSGTGAQPTHDDGQGDHRAAWYPRSDDQLRRRPIHAAPGSATSTLSSFRASQPSKVKPTSTRFQWSLPLLLCALLLLLLTVGVAFVIYFKPIDVPLDQVIQPGDYALQLVCDGDHPERKPCYSEDLVRQAYSYLQPLKLYLSTHAGYHECGYKAYPNRQVVSSRARKELTQRHGQPLSNCWEVLMRLVDNNAHWNMKISPYHWEDLPADQIWLESEEVVKPFACIVFEAMSKTLGWVIAVVVVSVLGFVAFSFGKSRKQREKENELLFEQMKHDIMKELEDQYNKSKLNSREPPFVPIGQLYDKLVGSSRNRAQLETVWEKVCDHITNREPRIRREVHQFQGEEYPIWRLIPAAGLYMR